MQTIDKFFGDYRFLSNFWFLDTPIIDRSNIEYRTNEHFFVAMKTIDLNQRHKIAAINKPGEAKVYGATLDLREDWERIKVLVMAEGLKQKFTQNQHLNEMLQATNNAILVEGNYWHDDFWGNCLCDQHRDKNGINALGILLMKTRLDLRQNGE